MSESTEGTAPVSGRTWSTFLRLWFVLGFSYFTVKFVFNLLFVGIDLRPVAFWEILVVPLGQAIAYWVVTRRRSIK